jgi:hypothetical protein
MMVQMEPIKERDSSGRPLYITGSIKFLDLLNVKVSGTLVILLILSLSKMIFLLVTRLKKWGMESYLYAPKDDYKHRAYWRELYTVEEAEHLTGILKTFYVLCK